MNKKVILITGTSKGIGKYLVEYYLSRGLIVAGCSRSKIDFAHKNYYHYYGSVSEEKDVKKIIHLIKNDLGRVDILVNNAGIASMNHFLLTPRSTFNNIFNTNVLGSFLFMREAMKLMMVNKWGRVVNFSTVATPLKLEGESVYAASKAAIVSLTEVIAKEVADYNITVNSIGPTPVKTDLIKSVPIEKMNSLINRQSIKRFGEFSDITNVIDFFISESSSFVTGQNIYLGGV